MEKAKNSLPPKQAAQRGLIRTFGRTRGKKLSARQQWLVDNLLPALAPDESDADGAILEIGFGMGEHIIELAEENLDKIIIGAEPFINGVASLLSRMTDKNNKVRPEYKNIRIWPDDVRKFLSHITYHISQNFGFAEIFILHPDPWPKARHEKRRLLSADFLKTLSSFISKDGSIVIGTDHADYHNWILEQIPRTDLRIKSRDIAAIRTKYQRKNMFGGDRTMYLTLSGIAG